jgi:hypothetical protein
MPSVLSMARETPCDRHCGSDFWERESKLRQGHSAGFLGGVTFKLIKGIG